MENSEDSFNVGFLSILAYIGPLFLVGKFSYERDNEDVKFNCNQGFRLFITVVLLYMMSGLVALLIDEMLSVVASTVGIALVGAVSVFWIIMAAVGIINAKKHGRVPLPIIGGKVRKD